jgi:methylthioribose-1-phosphate isomerase
MSTKRKEKFIVICGVMDASFFELLRKRHVKNAVVLEGRPRLDALRLNCAGLLKKKITPIVVADNMAGFLFFKDMVKEVWLSHQIAERDGAFCDVGGLVLAVLGKRHGIPVYSYPSGRITSLLGKSEELLNFCGVRIAPPETKTYVPLSEWVPKKYLRKIYG